MAVSLLKMHQIFMLALAKLRCVKAGGSGARCFSASPFDFLVFHLSDQVGALERQKKYQEDIFISK
jgi:hypothetical protein